MHGLEGSQYSELSMTVRGDEGNWIVLLLNTCRERRTGSAWDTQGAGRCLKRRAGTLGKGPPFLAECSHVHLVFSRTSSSTDLFATTSWRHEEGGEESNQEGSRSWGKTTEKSKDGTDEVYSEQNVAGLGG